MVSYPIGWLVECLYSYLVEGLVLVHFWTPQFLDKANNTPGFLVPIFPHMSHPHPTRPGGDFQGLTLSTPYKV
jgi:hypothetical protein